MKPSISRCKTSRSISKWVDFGLKLMAWGLLAFLPAVGCQVNRHISSQGSSSTSQQAPDGAEALELRAPLAPPPAPLGPDAVLLDVVRSDDSQRARIARIVKPQCQGARANALQVLIELNSSFGSHQLDLNLKGSSRGPTAAPLADALVRADVEGYRMSFPTPGGIFSELSSRACADPQSQDQSAISLADPLVEQVREWIETIAPDCDQVTLSANGWTCILPSFDPDEAREVLTGIQTTMITRWSRQPYLLARRVAVGITLAHAIRDHRTDPNLTVFCRILANSLDVELPATLANRRWKQAVCGPEAKNRRAAASFGLAKTVTEIDLMRHLFERTSRLGHLTLRLPSGSVSGRNILVSLNPESDVADKLAAETARLWANDGNDSGTLDSSPKSCWHPVYAEHPRLMDLARQLGMAGEASRIFCEDYRETRGTSPFPSSERYFADSVTSETEFVLQNGRARTLRLPSGRYSYTLRVLPDDTESWDDISQQSSGASGSILWDQRRPRPVISTWP